MPVITIKMDAGRSIEKKRQVAAAVTDAIVASLGGEASHVTILFEDYPRQDWAIGGDLQLDRHGPLKPGQHG
jgi:4-oxalocrotonate tautomerase